MKKLALFTMVGALGLFGCGGGGDSKPDSGGIIIDDTDAEADPPGTPDAGEVDPGACNPVSQAGCGAGEKCSWNTATETTVCAPNGDVAAGGECAYPEGGGVDNCLAGFLCDGVCKEICSRTPADSCSDGTCIGIDGVFQEGIGVCLPPCSVLGQDCPSAGDGCYLGPNGGVCAPAGDLPLGSECGFLNDCAPKSACLTSDGATFTCVGLCDYAAHMDMADGDNCKPAELCCGITDEEMFGACIETESCTGM